MKKLLFFLAFASAAFGQLPQSLKVNPITGAVVDPISSATFRSGNGFGSIATQSAASVAITGGTISGITDTSPTINGTVTGTAIASASALAAGTPGALVDAALIVQSVGEPDVLTSNTGTQNSTAINAALAISRTVKITKPGTYTVFETLLLSSGQTLWIGPGVTLKLGNSANRCMIRNANLFGSDHDITVTGGGTIDGNQVNNTQGNADSGSTYTSTGTMGLYACVGFVGVDRPRIENINFQNVRSFHVQFAACTDLIARDLHVTGGKRDTVHLNGPCTINEIAGISGDSEDDFVALNAWDWLNYSPHNSGTPTSGNITGGIIRNIGGLSSAAQGGAVRMMSATGAQVTDVTIDGVLGDFGGYGINVTLAADAESPSHTTTAAKTDRVTFRNLGYRCTSASNSTQMLLGLCGTISIDGFSQVPNPTTPDAAIALVGSVDKLSIKRASNSGHMVGPFIQFRSGSALNTLQIADVHLENSSVAGNEWFIEEQAGSYVGQINASNLYLKNLEIGLKNASGSATKISIANWQYLTGGYPFSVNASGSSYSIFSVNGQSTGGFLFHTVPSTSIRFVGKNQSATFSTALIDGDAAVSVNCPDFALDAALLTPLADDVVLNTNSSAGTVGIIQRNHANTAWLSRDQFDGTISTPGGGYIYLGDTGGHIATSTHGGNLDTSSYGGAIATNDHGGGVLTYTNGGSFDSSGSGAGVKTSGYSPSNGWLLTFDSSVGPNGSFVPTAPAAAAAGTLTGSTLASGVTASSLTSTGTLTSITVGTGGTSVARIKHGTATLVAGTVTVTDTTVTANTRIFPTRFTDGGTVGASYSVTRSAGASFTITAKDGSGSTQTSDTSVVAYEMIEP